MVLLASDLPKTLSENGDLDLRMFLPKCYLYQKLSFYARTFYSK